MTYILEAVNPRMGKDTKQLVSKSVTVCKHILAGDSTAHIAKTTTQLFGTSSFTPNSGEVQAIDAAITTTFCR